MSTDFVGAVSVDGLSRQILFQSTAGCTPFTPSTEKAIPVDGKSKKMIIRRLGNHAALFFQLVVANFTPPPHTEQNTNRY